MNIFLRRIPANTKHIEISEFIAPALNKGFFRKPGQIIDVQILALQDIRVGTIEYHGLVTLDSESTAQNAIRILRNRRLNGRLVVVRPYYHRSWYNDPRQERNPAGIDFVEKRRNDRRRGQYLQIIKNVSDRFNSEDDFFNSLNHQRYLINFMVPEEIEESVTQFIRTFGTEPQDEDSMPSLPKLKPIRMLAEPDGEEKTYSFQIQAARKESNALLEKMKTEFSGAGIQYWVVPVVENGEL